MLRTLRALLEDERGNYSLEQMLWIALFVLGVAVAAGTLKNAVSNLASKMAAQIDDTN